MLGIISIFLLNFYLLHKVPTSPRVFSLHFYNQGLRTETYTFLFSSQVLYNNARYVAYWNPFSWNNVSFPINTNFGIQSTNIYCMPTMCQGYSKNKTKFLLSYRLYSRGRRQIINNWNIDFIIPDSEKCYKKTKQGKDTRRGREWCKDCYFR